MSTPVFGFVPEAMAHSALWASFLSATSVQSLPVILMFFIPALVTCARSSNVQTDQVDHNADAVALCALTRAPSRIALVKSASSRSADSRSVARKVAPEKFAPFASAPNRDTPLKSELLKFVCLSSALVYAFLRRSLLERSS